MSRRLVSPRVVGRATELATIVHALERAAAAQPVHVVIAGEAGVGKSRLVREAVTMAEARGMRVLVGGCANIGDGGMPYGPIVDALRVLARDLDPAALDALAGPARADLARLVPSLSPGSGAESGPLSESLHPRLLDAVLGVLQRLAATAPVLLVVEDLHWADPATRETVAFLVRNLTADRVLLVLTFRSDELHRRHPLLPWLAEVDRSGRVERLDLDRLGPEETRELLAAILGTTPSADLVEQIHRRSDGNPFFVEELVRAGSDGPPARLPPTLREVLLARIAALPEAAQAVVGVAAVAGRPVDHDLLTAVAGMDESRLLDGLRGAVAGQVLEAEPGSADPGDYTFRHALFQEAAYDDLLPGERLRLHRAFAEALAARVAGSGAVAAGHWAELAYHWTAARDDRRAFEASVRAGDEAARTFAFADALRHDERALELWARIEDPAALAGIDRLALLDRAAQAAWLAGDARRAVALRRDAVAEAGTDNPIRRGTALERLGRALWSFLDVPGALEAHQAAIDAMPVDPPTPERARALSGYGQLLMLLDRTTESVAVCEEAVAIGREVGARQPLGHALSTLGLDLAMLGRCEQGIDASEEAVSIAREISNPDDLGRGWINLSEVHLYCGDLRAATRAVNEGIRVSDEVGLGRTYGRWARENGIVVAYELGNWDEAERLAQESAAIPAAGRQAQRYGLARWIALLVARGDPGVPERLKQLRDLLEGYPVESQFTTPWRIADAEAAIWRGDPASGLATARTGIAELQGLDWHWFHPRLYRVGLRAAADLAEAVRARRDAIAETAAIEEGDRLWDELGRLAASARERQVGLDARQTDAEVATAAAERLRMRGAAALEAWDDAAGRWQARENPYLVAYCRWRAGEEQLRAGRRPAALAALRESREIAVRLGAVPLETAIGALATRARLDVSEPAARPARMDPFGLTRREAEVLALLMAGHTNRQIAEALFISENTAGVHVSNILGKLGASTRTEAAGIAVRVGFGTG